MKAMETLQDLIEEAKIRTVWWALCIFAVSYFLTHTSQSMWINIPIAVLLVSGLRILFNEVEFHWKDRKVQQKTYLSHLEKKQLSVNDYRLSTLPPPPKWKRKIDSPIVEAAIQDFINKLLQDFVVDLWYSRITPDKEAPELIYAVIMDVLGELSGRIKEINLVELLTRDLVDLIGDHLDLFRRHQAAIGVDVMVTLSSEERDERLKHHLMASKELHPALISSECEYKVLQQLMGGVLAIVLRPKESQCPLVRCIARELLTCLVMQPIMNLASPVYINQLIECIFTALKDEGFMEAGVEQHPEGIRDGGCAVNQDSAHISESYSKKFAASNDQSDMRSSRFGNQRGLSSDVQESSSSNAVGSDSAHPRPGDWARVLEAATQRRTEVLTPENLENMWAIGRNYKKKLRQNAATGLQAPEAKDVLKSSITSKDSVKHVPVQKPQTSNLINDKSLMQLPKMHLDNQLISGSGAINDLHFSLDLSKNEAKREGFLTNSYAGFPSGGINDNNTSRLKRSNSTSDLRVQLEPKGEYANRDGPTISGFYSADYSRSRYDEVPTIKNASDLVLKSEATHAPKLKSRVVGAYFEKLGSKSFAVYSIAVTDTDKNTWFVKRRYSNFERLHRHLKDIPNYTLHLPPKRIFSSSTEDAFVHQRCIQLDKYLQDLLSISNVAEQHEVWDFLSISSKNYSFGKSSSVMKTLAVNVDDAMDDIVRQFRGVSDGLMRKVVGSPSSSSEPTLLDPPRHLSLNVDDMKKVAMDQCVTESAHSFSDDGSYKDESQVLEEAESSAQAKGWHSDNELNSKLIPPRVVRLDDKFSDLDSEKKHDLMGPSKQPDLGRSPESSLMVISDRTGDPVVVPPEWTPPNLSLPVLNLVDKIFQLNKRGWLRRQVFWISKQILQLMMEDAIDDWLLRQIHWLRREDVVAQGIRWIQNVLWPDGRFFLKLNIASETDNCLPNQGSMRDKEQLAKSNVYRPGSFEQQLEASRRASDLKKMLYNGAPSTLVSLIGQKQYRRCARDLYYFLQSTICLKQLAYGALEVVLVSIFPELCDLVMDVHEKMQS